MIHNKTDGIILDVDGTLWDSTPIVAAAWTKAVRDSGCGDLVVTAETLRQLFGRTMKLIADLLLPEVEEKRRYECLDLCCKYEHDALEADPCEICYDGVIDTIKELSRKFPVFIVSNCQAGYIELFLQKTQLEAYVQDIECFGNNGKNKGENIRLLMERNGLKYPIYVGDTQGDCDASKEAGIPFVYVTYGFGTADTKAAEIEQFSDLLKLTDGEVAL